MQENSWVGFARAEISDRQTSHVLVRDYDAGTATDMSNNRAILTESVRP